MLARFFAWSVLGALVLPTWACVITLSSDYVPPDGGDDAGASQAARADAGVDAGEDPGSPLPTGLYASDWDVVTLTSASRSNYADCGALLGEIIRLDFPAQTATRVRVTKDCGADAGADGGHIAPPLAPRTYATDAGSPAPAIVPLDDERRAMLERAIHGLVPIPSNASTGCTTGSGSVRITIHYGNGNEVSYGGTSDNPDCPGKPVVDTVMLRALISQADALFR